MIIYSAREDGLLYNSIIIIMFLLVIIIGFCSNNLSNSFCILAVWAKKLPIPVLNNQLAIHGSDQSEVWKLYVL